MKLFRLEQFRIPRRQLDCEGRPSEQRRIRQDSESSRHHGEHGSLVIRKSEAEEREKHLAAEGENSTRSQTLTDSRALLERSRLVQEDTLCHDSMTKVERKWLRSDCPPEAKHWNLLTDLDVRHLAYA